MTVPMHYRSSQGRVYRVERARDESPTGRSRYRLRAIPIQTDEQQAEAVEVAYEMSDLDALDRIRRRLVIDTPEQVYEQLWQRLHDTLDRLPGDGAPSGNGSDT